MLPTVPLASSVHTFLVRLQGATHAGWNADDLQAVPREPPPPGGNGGEPAPRIGAQRTWPSAWWKSFPLTRRMRIVRSEGTVHPTAQPLYLRTSPTAAVKASNILVLQWGGVTIGSPVP